VGSELLMSDRNLVRPDGDAVRYLGSMPWIAGARQATTAEFPADHRPPRWYADFEYALRNVHLVISSSFARAEPRLRALQYMFGLSGILVEPARSRRNIASGAGKRRTEGAQRLLTMARWDEADARAKLRELVLERAGPGGDLYVIEASFAKRGSSAVATERQCSAENGWIESCQSAILMFYGAVDGSLFLVDIDLYVPPSWVANADRRRHVRMPPHTVYRSKSRIARDMVDDATALGLDPGRVTLSLFCSEKSSLLGWLQGKEIQYLAALTAGEFRDLAAVRSLMPPGMIVADRSASRGIAAQYPTAVYFRAASRQPLADNDMNRMIAEFRRMDLRWRSMRRHVLIDRYEVRSWHGWQRHMTLAMAVQIAQQLAGH
jgi:hypothetical protein